MFCHKCGNKITENAAFCPKCGTKITGGNTAQQLNMTACGSAATELPSVQFESDLTNEKSPVQKPHKFGNLAGVELSPVVQKSTELFGRYKEMNVFEKIYIGLAVLLGAFVVYIVIDKLFSSGIALIVVAVGGYALYHLYIAKYITKYKYDKESKVLQLPEGMNSEALFQALSGKFNYPYFKGVRYGENGECLIEGQYSVCSVIFNENNEAMLDCQIDESDKKVRSIMLEAIAIRHYINKFFNPSLPFDAVQHFNSLKFAEKQRKTVAIVVSIAVTIAIGAIALEHAAPGSLKHITTPGAGVRNAYLSQYSNSVTIENAFNNFFEKPQWSTFEKEGASYVAFSGRCELRGEKVDVRILFKITGDNFIADKLEVNGREQNNFMLTSLLTAIYDKSEQTHMQTRTPPKK